MKQNRTMRDLEALRNGLPLSTKEQLLLILQLSYPAILAQLSSVVMQYIDASMVGNMGATQAASIGLVSTSTWLLGSVAYASVSGFTVQTAQKMGANRLTEAKGVMKLSLLTVFVISLMLAGIGFLLANPLPAWLGGSETVNHDASMYFLVYSLGIPFMGMNALAGGMLQSTGSMKIPGILNSVMCLLDVIFNFLLIFPTTTYRVLGMNITMPGAGMGVAGAALGTALAELVTAGIMLWVLLTKSQLRIKKHEKIPMWNGSVLKKALVIATPVAFEHFVVCFAMVVTTRIIAPLGVVAIAANSFAITAESLCYMPGYGVSDAAATLVGQSVGAGRKDMARRFARRTAYFGFVCMIFLGIVIYVAAPFMIGILTNDPEVLALGTKILRIEAFAEPLYVSSIIISGGLRGAGDTLVPSLLNFLSLWAVRIPLAFFLSRSFGLTGVWIAMCLELIFRGSLFFIRLWREKWLKK